MPADFSPYINLRLYDKQPGDIYSNAIEVAQMTIPDFNLRTGTVEDAMFQAMAYMTSIATTHINTLPNRLMEGMLSFMGVERSVGNRAAVSVAITLLTLDGASIPAGTIFAHETLVFDDVVVTYYETSVAYEIPASETSNPSVQTIFIVARDEGIVPEVASGDEFKYIQFSSLIGTIVASTDFTQGTDPENDSEYLSRGATYLQSLSENFVTAEQIERYIISTYASVSRCVVYDLTNAEGDITRGGTNVSGYVAIFVYGQNRSLGVLEQQAILRDVVSKSHAGLSIFIKDITLISPTIAITVHANSSYVLDSIESYIRASLQSYLDPVTFPKLEPLLRTDVLRTLVQSTPGVDYVDSLTLSALGSTRSSTNAAGREMIYKGDLPSYDSTLVTITLIPNYGF
jgi:hypothetical protein